MRYTGLSALALALSLAVLAGCDSGSSNDDVVDCEDVDGRYGFTRFTFTPSVSGPPQFNVLDTLDANQTELQLFSDCQFELEYEYQGDGDFGQIQGRFTATGTEVRLMPDNAEEARRLFLQPTTRLEREPARVLDAEIEMLNVNLGQFDPDWDNIRADGTIHIELTQK